MPALRQRLSELRTLEADGEGTDPRLVLLEALNVGHRLARFHCWVATGANNSDGRGLERGLDGRPYVQAGWVGVDLQEVTMLLRDVDDLLGALTLDFELGDVDDDRSPGTPGADE